MNATNHAVDIAGLGEVIPVNTGQMETPSTLIVGVDRRGRVVETMPYYGRSFTCPKCNTIWAVYGTNDTVFYPEPEVQGTCRNPDCEESR